VAIARDEQAIQSADAATDPGAAQLAPAAAFYALYPIGIVAFGVLPAVAAQDWVRAATMSALFGFLAYVTYELTNLATLKGWSAQIAMMDIAWGAALSGVAGAAGYWAVRTWTDR